jgi:hypothetical protein
LILFLRLFGTLERMTKPLTSAAQRSNAERQLFSARRALAHLVEMYDKGQWSLYYRSEKAFAEAVREARQAVERWSDVMSKCDSGSAVR